MIFIFNQPGIITCFTPALVLTLIWGGLPYSALEVWTLAGPWGAIVFVADVWYRAVHRDVPWHSPGRGGHIYFIPVFLLGLGSMALYIHFALAHGYWLPHQKVPAHPF